MDFRTRERVLQQIAAGVYVIKYNNEMFIYREPTNSLLSFLLIRQSLIEEECGREGFYTEDQEKQLLLSMSLWSEDTEKRLAQMTEDIDKLRKDKNLYEYQSHKLKQIDELINVLQDEILKLIKIKNTFFTDTVRYQSQYRYYCTVLQQCLYKSDGMTLYWPTIDDLEGEQDNRKLDYFLRTIFYEGLWGETEIRELARSEPWRSTWKIAEKSGSLFSRISSELTHYQHTLCYWSMVYDSVYENPDSPSSEVIDNDELLNNWLIRQQQEHNAKKKGKAVSNPITNAKIANSQNIGIVVNSPEDAQKVYNNLNTSESRRILRERQSVIKEKGKVKVMELPDVQRDYQMQLNQQFSQSIKKT